MTTMELIEKYGIGFNCLADAYDLGVKHGKEEANAKIEPLVKDINDRVYVEGIERGRADKTDEAIAIIKEFFVSWNKKTRRRMSYVAMDELISCIREGRKA